MNTTKRVLFFFVLPIIGVLSYDPTFLFGVPVLLGIVILFLLGLGYLQWKGNSNALTFAIFLHGMNTIVRIMMIASTSLDKNGVFHPAFTAFGMVGLIISFYLMLRLDKVDVRKTFLH